MSDLFDWRAHVRVHPVAEEFPLMEDAALAELANDIAANGLLLALTFWRPSADSEDAALLDGRNRLDALAKAGKLSLNAYRRHLKPEQKREIIAGLLKANPGQSNRAIAKQGNWSDKTVASVRKGLEATAELPQLKEKIGLDGRTRPATKPQPEREPEDLILKAHYAAKPVIKLVQQMTPQQRLVFRRQLLERIADAMAGKPDGIPIEF
jgi:hypothetical protein